MYLYWEKWHKASYPELRPHKVSQVLVWQTFWMIAKSVTTDCLHRLCT